MENSILTSVKKLLGIAEDYTEFDMDIIIHINSVFVTLQQLGVGPEEGFSISDSSTTWSSYLNDDKLLNNVISYMGLRVKMLFDPPTNSSILSSYERTIQELEWRINVMVDPKEATSG